MYSFLRRFHGDKDRQVTVIFAVFLFVMVGIAVLAIDMSYTFATVENGHRLRLPSSDCGPYARALSRGSLQQAKVTGRCEQDGCPPENSGAHAVTAARHDGAP